MKHTDYESHEDCVNQRQLEHQEEQCEAALGFGCLALLVIIVTLVVTSCAGMAERVVTRVDGTTSTTRVAVIAATDANEFSPPGWSIKGVRQSHAAERITKGVVTTTAINAFAPAATELTGGLSGALNNITKP